MQAAADPATCEVIVLNDQDAGYVNVISGCGGLKPRARRSRACWVGDDHGDPPDVSTFSGRRAFTSSAKRATVASNSVDSTGFATCA